MGEQAFIIEGDLVRERQEDVLYLPSSPRRAPNVSCNLENRLEREKSLSPKPKKKRSREPSLVLPAKTKSHSKLDLGVRSRSRGRRHASQVKEDETKRSLVV